MNSTVSGGNVSKSVAADVREAHSVHQSSNAKARRAQRAEEHRAGVDHGKGCVHCDVVHGR